MIIDLHRRARCYWHDGIETVIAQDKNWQLRKQDYSDCLPFYSVHRLRKIGPFRYIGPSICATTSQDDALMWFDAIAMQDDQA